MTIGKPSRKKTDGYVTLSVMRPLSSKERKHVELIDDPVERNWEIDRYTHLFDMAVFAHTDKEAIKLLRKLLSSSKLIVEVRDGKRVKDVKKVSTTKRKSRRV
jgi:hypothetical protein